MGRHARVLVCVCVNRPASGGNGDDDMWMRKIDGRGGEADCTCTSSVSTAAYRTRACGVVQFCGENCSVAFRTRIPPAIVTLMDGTNDTATMTSWDGLDESVTASCALEPCTIMIVPPTMLGALSRTPARSMSSTARVTFTGAAAEYDSTLLET
jgi:hypothetical protein